MCLCTLRKAVVESKPSVIEKTQERDFVEEADGLVPGIVILEGLRRDQVVWMVLPDERGRADIFEHHLRELKLDPRLAPDRLATELASAIRGMTGADIAYLCQRAAMCCVKDAVCTSELADIAITHRHFDAALLLLTADNATEAAPEPRHLLLAG